MISPNIPLSAHATTGLLPAEIRLEIGGSGCGLVGEEKQERRVVQAEQFPWRDNGTIGSLKPRATQVISLSLSILQKKIHTITNEAAKKLFFLVARPLRPSPPPSSLVGPFFSGILFSSFKKIIFS